MFLMIMLQALTADSLFESGKVPDVRQLVWYVGMNEKRAAYILEKWCGKDWYEYGVSVFAGWLTKEGRLVDV